MSLRAASRNNLQHRTWGGNVPQVITDRWVRHPAWATLPTITSSDSKVAGLHAVWPESNFLALTCAGNYTVDWGDGNVENFSSGVTAYHQYDYTNAALANTNGPVTFTDAGDLVNRTAHGFSNGQRVAFFNIATTTGIAEGVTYYVINASANSFQIATSPGGSAVALTNDGSGTLLPYKQAVVVITPNGGTLTQVNLNVKHNQTGLQKYCSGWLELLIGGKDFNTTGITIGSTSGTNNLNYYQLQKVSAVSFGSQVNLTYMLNDCRALRTVDFGDSTANVTSMSYMFYYCTTLLVVPPFNMSSVDVLGSMFQYCFALVAAGPFHIPSATSAYQMFSGCNALTTVSLSGTSSLTDASYMFQNCAALVAAPFFDTSHVTLMASMFSNCPSLTTVPLYNTASVTSMNSIFGSCGSLETVPLFNTGSVTDMSSMFAYCNTLAAVPLFDTSHVTSMSSMFSNCGSLLGVPLFNTALVTSMVSMFANCYNLVTVPPFSTSGVTSMNGMFSGCSALTSVPAMSAAGATASTSYNTMFSGCSNLSSIKMTGFKYTFSIFGCKLSGAALDALYTNLASVSAQTITVTNNWGTATDTPSIATAKGWTVTGS